MRTLAYLREHRGLALQWFGVLAPAGAWSTQFLVDYNLSHPLSCSPAAIRLVNDHLKLILTAVNALTAVVAVASGVVAYACWRRVRASDPAPGGRAHWLAIAGMMSSVLFLILILTGFLPLAFLAPCAQAP
jgi:hypothetical protein